MAEERKLASKLAEIAGAVRYAHGENNGNSFSNGFNEGEFFGALRHELSKRMILVLPNVTELRREIKSTVDGPQTLAYVNMEFAFWDGETGERIAVRFPGCAVDDDHGRGVYRAMDQAHRLALAAMFATAA